jgi:membrane-associated protein
VAGSTSGLHAVSSVLCGGYSGQHVELLDWSSVRHIAIIDSGKVKALTPERMAKLDHFFAKYGGLTIVITRFMPFFRTFAPFIAGTGHMNFAKFTLFNTIGGVSWVSLFVLVGYFFGGITFVQEHFEFIILGIVAVSVAPAIIGAIKAAMKSSKKKKNNALEGDE